MPLRRPHAAEFTDARRVRRALDTHYDAIWRFLRRLGVPPAEVEDAAQKVFIVFAERAPSIGASSEKSFLFASALRIAADARRKQAGRREELSAERDSVDREDPAPSVDDQLDAHRRRRHLDEVLDSLSDEHRAVLTLVDLHEQTMVEASDVLGIPPGTVASRRARELFEVAAAELKAKLDRLEEESTR